MISSLLELLNVNEESSVLELVEEVVKLLKFEVEEDIEGDREEHSGFGADKI